MVSHARLVRIRAAVAQAFVDDDVTADEAATVLASLLIDLMVEARHGNSMQVASEMRRMAQRLVQLADVPLAEMRTLAVALADATASSTRN